MTETLLWIILVVAAVTAIAAIAMLLRSWRGYQGAGQEVRNELRAGRDESRVAGKELREEVSGGLKSSTDAISKTLYSAS